MVLPLHDRNPTHRFPVLTVLLIALNIAIFAWMLTKPNPQSFPESQFPHTQAAVLCEYGILPDRIVDGRVDPPDRFIELCTAKNEEQPRAVSLITHQFMHGSWFHLLGNMLFLWIFGNNIEDRLGRVRFLPFYLLCGLIAAIGQIATDPGSTAALVGASGAISGILGAYMMLFPRARVLALLVVVPLRIPAWVVLGLYLLFQFFYVSQASQTEGGVAYWAHIIGFIAGFALIRPFLVGRPPPPPPRPGVLGEAAA